MNELIKIRDISARYDITARTLRYYEDMGLIISTRSDDYAYRMYDENAVRRLEQILILRKLNISIKDIQRIFNTSGSEAVLEVLGKKVQSIDDEIALLHELKNIVLDFIHEIEKIDFANNADIKSLYDKAKEIETQLISVDYVGKPSNINRLIEISEKLDKKVPDVMIVKIPKFRAFTTGLVGWDKVFDMGSDVKSRELSARGLTMPILFDGHDFLYGKDGKAAWIWRIKDEATETDTHPFEITEFQGGLYAVSVSVDGDGESHDKVRSKTAKWLETTNFVMDNEREMLGHMIYTHDHNPEIIKGLGYEQLVLYAPVKLKED
jgi:DNA-binding transcriptional MerR regulator